MRRRASLEIVSTTGVSMSYPLLEDYIERLPRAASAERRIWRDEAGHAQGRYFNCTLTSVFQPLFALQGGAIAGYEAFIRSAAGELSVWKLLEGAASDAESVELDRLCRMLHAINFWRQAEAGSADLYLSVHERLLAAVAGDHGVVFRRVLAGLGLPIARIVLQLPSAAAGAAPHSLQRQVAANYRRNGFRIGLNAANPAEGLRLLEQIDPDVLKLDAREIADADALEALGAACAARGVALVFKRVESAAVAAALQRLQGASRFALAQGRAWGEPRTGLCSEQRIAPLPQGAGARAEPHRAQSS
jgi:EAL domain-containing protein (putative c-di-GMP-specific phosphodiesterase class I)